MDRNRCFDTEVTRVEHVGPRSGGQFLLGLKSVGWRTFSPGQFAMIRPGTLISDEIAMDPILARPFSIAWADDEELLFLVQQVGRGTRQFAQLRPGDPVTGWGPLGSFFARDNTTPTLLLAGGIGLAPFMGYARKFDNPDNLELLLGHTLPVDNFPMDFFDGLAKTVDTFHQKTSRDLNTFIAILDERIAAYGDGRGLVAACGPTPFLKTVDRLASKHGAKAQLSLENTMACGVGACLGCVTSMAQGGNAQVCTRGPVFWAHDLDLEA
jgi:dihydroorotate dehydrogenase electron transfer subunit